MKRWDKVTHATYQGDQVFLWGCAILLLFGFLMLSSASAPVGYAKFGDSYFFVKRQFLFGVLPGIVLFFLASSIDYHRIESWHLPVYAGTLLLLITVFLPGVGTTLGTGARSWISFGSFSFQPSEVVKLTLILSFSVFLSRQEGYIREFQRGFLLTLGIGSLPIVLVLFQPDIGTATILFAIVFILLFAAGTRLHHLLGLACVGLVGFALLIAIAPYRLARLTTFLHPELDPQGIGYQINQAFLAIGSGGIFGLGLGHSRQKFQYLPEVHADSIFAVIGEEMGFVVTLGFLALILLICFRGLRIARLAPDMIGRLIVTGIIAWFMVQSIFNIGAMVGLLPLTGVPLPFVSHGGTALMVSLAAVGVMFNVSKHIHRL